MLFEFQSKLENVAIAKHCNLKASFFNNPTVPTKNQSMEYKISTQFYEGVKVRKLMLNFDRSHLSVALVLKQSKISKLYLTSGRADN